MLKIKTLKIEDVQINSFVCRMLSEKKENIIYTVDKHVEEILEIVNVNDFLKIKDKARKEFEMFGFDTFELYFGLTSILNVDVLRDRADITITFYGC